MALDKDFKVKNGLTVADSISAGGNLSASEGFFNGDVGIGTSSPSAALTVEGSANDSTFRLDSFSGSGYIDALMGNTPYFRLYQSNGNRLQIGPGDGNINRFNSSNTALDLSFATNGGNVGIGTTSPAYQLTLGGNAVDSTEGLRINDPSNAAYGAHFSFSDTPNEVWIGGVTNNTYNSAIGIHRDTTRAITIDNNGNVGIGTTSPIAKLDIRTPQTTAAFTNPALKLLPSSTTNDTGLTSISFSTTSVTTSYGFSVNAWRRSGNDTFTIKSHSNSATGIDRLVIQNNGNVGIGTTSPASLLEISNGSAAEARVTSAPSYGGQAKLWLKTATAGNTLLAFGPSTSGDTAANATGGISYSDYYSTLSIKTNSSTRMTINSSGNVGIGTTSPIAKLDVAGNIAATGNIAAAAYLNTDASSSRSKLRLYGTSSSFAIGMESAVTFAGLNDWAMAFQFNNDSDRGFWWGDDAHSKAQGAMALTTDGRLTVASKIKVGFGESDTTSPDAPLQIASGTTLPITTAPNGSISFGSISSTTTPTILGRTTTNVTGLYLASATTNATVGGDMVFNVRENNNTAFGTLTNTAFRFQHYTTDLLRILRNGNVGIGTAGPASLLEISKSVLAEARVTSASGGYGGQANLWLKSGTYGSSMLAFGPATSGDIAANAVAGISYNHGSSILDIKTNSSTKMTINSSGNVGIGTTSPTEKLEVAGNIVADNFFPPTQIMSHSIGTYTASTINSGTASNEGGGMGLGINSSTSQAAVRTERYFAAGRGSGQSTRLDQFNTVVGVSFMRTFVDDSEAFINIGTGAGTPVTPTETTKGVFILLKKAAGAYTLELHHNRGTAATNSSTSATVSVNLSRLFQIEVRTTIGGTIEVFTSNTGEPPTLLLSLTGLTFGQNGGASDNNVWIGYRSTGYATYYGIGVTRVYTGYYRT